MHSLEQVIYFLEQRQQTEDWDIRGEAIVYLKGYQEVLPEYAQMKADAALNDPLTWDELKGMVGKPVWVVEEGYQTWEYWGLVYWMNDDELILLNENGQTTYSKNEQGTLWQAYRKERE